MIQVLITVGQIGVFFREDIEMGDIALGRHADTGRITVTDAIA
jgi:hypothetical protein